MYNLKEDIQREHPDLITVTIYNKDILSESELILTESQVLRIMKEPSLVIVALSYGNVTANFMINCKEELYNFVSKVKSKGLKATYG